MTPFPTSVPTPCSLVDFDLVLAKDVNLIVIVIITAFNRVWGVPNNMIDLFIDSFHVGEGTPKLLNNMLIVALDKKVYNRCLQIHLHCYSSRESLHEGNFHILTGYGMISSRRIFRRNL
jgi:hypothetical protein